MHLVWGFCKLKYINKLTYIMKAIFTIIFALAPLFNLGVIPVMECLEFEYSNDEYSIENAVADIHVTVYHAVPAQCNADWQHTADMTYLGEDVDDMYRHRIVAVSRDFLTEYGFEMGDTIKVHGLSVPEYNGEWIIHDKMNKRYTNRMDFLVNPGMKAFQRDENVYIWK